MNLKFIQAVVCFGFRVYLQHRNVTIIQYCCIGAVVSFACPGRIYGNTICRVENVTSVFYSCPLVLVQQMCVLVVHLVSTFI